MDALRAWSTAAAVMVGLALAPAAEAQLPFPDAFDSALGSAGGMRVLPAPEGDGDGRSIDDQQRAIIESVPGDAMVVAGAGPRPGESLLDGYLHGLDGSGRGTWTSELASWGGTGPVAMDASPSGHRVTVAGVDGEGTLHVLVAASATGEGVREGHLPGVAPPGTPVADVVLTGDNTVTVALGSSPWKVARVRPEGASLVLDPGFDDDGVAEGDSGTPPAALEVLDDGGVVLTGRAGFAGRPFLRFVWLDPDGRRSTAPWTTNGESSPTPFGAAFNGVRDLARAPDGKLVVLTDDELFTTCTNCTWVFRVDPATGASSDGRFAEFGQRSSLTVDEEDRVFYAGGDGTLGTLGRGAGFPDRFGSTADDLSRDGSARLVWAGRRSGVLVVGRKVPFTFIGGIQADPETETSGPGVSEVPLREAAVPPVVGSEEEGARVAAAPLRSSPLRSSPLRSSPLRSSPLRSSPLRSSPLRSSPLRSSPLRSSPLTAIPLRSSPLRSSPLRSSSWSTLLDGTALAGRPQQSVTFGDVLDLLAAGADLDLRLGDLDVARSPLRGVSIASMYLFYRPVRALGPWCEALRLCSSASTLADLELAGRSLGDLWSIPLALTPEVQGAGTDAVAPLAEVALDDVDLARTPIGDMALVTFAELCATTGCEGRTGTMAEVQAADPAAFAGSTLGDALAVLRSRDEVLSLQQVLPGLVADEELPVEEFPLSELLVRGDPDAGGAQTISGSVDLDCRPLRSAFAILELVAFPGEGDGKVVNASGRVRLAGSPDWLALGGPDAGRADPAWSEADDRPLLALCDGRTSLSLEFEVGFVPGNRLGRNTMGFGVRVSPEDFRAQFADFQVTDADDTSPAAPGALRAEALRTGYVAQPGDVDTYTFPAPPPGSVVSFSLTNPGAVASGGGECECPPTFTDTDVDLHVQGPPTGIPLPPSRESARRLAATALLPIADPLRASTADEDREVPDGASASGPLSPASLRTTPVRAQSTRRGGADEGASVLVRETDRGATFRVTVSGRGDDSAPTPYALRATVTPPPTTPPCIADRSIGVAAAGTSAAVPTNAQTLLLWNRQRTAGTYGAARADALEAKLGALAAATQGAVLAVDADAGVRAAYAAWDDEPCSTGAANDVVSAIGRVVDGAVPGRVGLRHLVLVGADDLLPQARVPDLAGIANEREEADALAFGGRDTPTSRALREGLVLSDDPYGDLDPHAWLEGTLAVPDLALGRLVETADDAIAQIDRYLASGGVLAPQTARVMGYDFLADGSQAVLEQLRALGVQASATISETWTAADALATLNRPGAGITSVNGHYDHFRGLPAGGSPLFAADDATPAAGSLLFTMGCHAGLNAVDVYVHAPGEATEPALHDWSQVLTGRGSLFVGNTGYGYGDPSSVAYSERLMTGFAAQIATRRATAGQALMYAKQRYMATLQIPGVYDAKALQEATFYGLPMYRIGAAGTTGAPALPPADVTGTDPALATSFDVQPAFAEQRTARGRWWSADGKDPIVAALKPIQPRTDLDVTPADRLPVHGALITGLASRDVEQVDPAHATPTIDLAAREPELAVRDAAFPAVLQRVEVLGAADGRHEVLNLVAGQFLEGDVQRLFTRIRGDVLRSASGDWAPPRIDSAAGQVGGGSLRVVVRSPDEDAVGGSVLYLDEAGIWRSAALIRGSDGWSATGPVQGRRVPTFYVQLRDAAGNVGADTNKGGGFVASPDSSCCGQARLDFEADPDTVIGTVPWFRGPAALTVQPSDGALLGDFALEVDGLRQAAVERLVVGGDGTHVVRLIRIADDTVVTSRRFRIDATAPVLTGTPAGTASDGWYRDDVLVGWACDDGELGSGVAPEACPEPTLVTGEGAGLSATATALDRLGNEGRRTVPVRIDRTPPVVALTLPGGPTTSAAAITVVATASDALSGVTGVTIGQAAATPGSAGTWSRSVALNCEQPTTIAAAATDRAGNVTTSAPVTVTRTCATATGPRAALQALRDEMAALAATLPTKQGDRLRKAAASVDAATAPELWSGPSSLVPRKGHVVFNELKHALVQLGLVAADKSASPAARAAARAYGDRIAAVGRQLVEAAITAAGGRIAKLAKAIAALLASAAQSDPGKAIDDLRQAWERATGT